jgi:hypothetical protein
MPGRTPREAVEAFSAPLRESLACILPPTAVLLAQGHRPDGGPYLLALAGQRGPATLEAPVPLGLFITHRYAVIESGDAPESWRVHSREYSYELTAADARPIMRWDWHPDGQAGEDPVAWPHVHLRGYTQPVDLSRGHVPTGRVSLEAIVRYLIRDLRVQQRRPDWAAVLDRNEAAFIAHRSWG